ncbi:hypothetical protein [Streptomyces sp. NPDC014733]|uniref:hypothetical protein n=1 Tax=Streptomyces sp. NPDC014733 TaxID=3364885 RepID=UPI0036F54D5C
MTHRTTDDTTAPGPQLPGAGIPLPDPAAIDPAILGALLARHGWHRTGGPGGRYARWTPPGGGAGLLVPQDPRFPECAELLAEALATLSVSPAPYAREVLLGMAALSDEVRWERLAPGTGSVVARWVAQEQLRGAARATLGAAALASCARAGYYGSRYRGHTERYLAEALLGPAPEGLRLAAFIPVSVGRGPVITLHRALRAARDATDHRRATGGTEAFDAAVAFGVCHELVQALIALVHEGGGIRITVDWSPGAGPPPGCPVRPGPVEFTTGDLPALADAAQRYVRGEPSLPVRVTGAVVRLHRERPGGGVVRLRVITGADVEQVRVALGDDDYRVAGQAHLMNLPVRISGRLESRGGFRRLTGARGVVPLPTGDPEPGEPS